MDELHISDHGDAEAVRALESLAGRGLLTSSSACDKEGNCYHVTPKGHRFLTILEELSQVGSEDWWNVMPAMWRSN